MTTGARAVGRWGWPIALVAVVGLGAALRLPDLDLKPLHHDESVNGWFTLRLWWWNLYRYNASDYHGPFLYYLEAALFAALGPSETSLRLGPALAGVAAPLALLPARRWFGAPGWAAAGLLLAASPTSVYFGRTAIHEVLLVLGAALWASCLARFASRPRLGWALGASGAAALCFTNKETAVLTAASLGVGAALAWAFGRRDADDLLGGRTRVDAALAWSTRSGWAWAAGAALFAVLIVAFFSSFGTFWPGVGRFFAAFTPWLEHGSTGRNQGKPWDYFLRLAWHGQGVAAIFVVLAAVAAAWRRAPAGLALLGWWGASLLAYSVIPYKTPWCGLNIDLPGFALLGWAAGQLPRARWIAPLLGLALAAPLTVEAARVSRDAYDDPALPYVYVQTQRGFLPLVADHLGVARHLGGDGVEALAVGTKNPLRWYLLTRGWPHERVRYEASAKPEDLGDALIVSATGADRHGLGERLRADGWHEETYAFRPGWQVQAWYPAAAWAAWAAERDGAVPPPVVPRTPRRPRR